MRKIEKRRRRQRGRRREAIPAGVLHRLISGQDSLRDQVALLLLGKLALRREDLRLLRIADIDLGRDEIYLRHAKGGEEHVLPIGFTDLRDTLYLHLQAEEREPAEYLLYPKAERTTPLSRAGIANWFTRCCDEAGVVGYTMHQLRHAAADAIYRGTGDKGAAQALLRHRNPATTEVYLHPDVGDLRRHIKVVEGGGESV